MKKIFGNGDSCTRRIYFSNESITANIKEVVTLHLSETDTQPETGRLSFLRRFCKVL